MKIIEKKLELLLARPETLVEETTRNAQIATQFQPRVEKLIRERQIQEGERYVRIIAELTAESHLNVGLFHMLYGDVKIGEEELLKAKADYERIDSTDIAAEISEYMKQRGLSKAI
ncbi:MAG: hypothetical protein PHO02_07110 [Candidatus Nanoarchaeia archaeon]|nr:hypothetical protein [Candidatus Nanoarchaeia archaeon]